MGWLSPNMVATSLPPEGESSPRRAVIAVILTGLLSLAAFLIGCDRTSTSDVVTKEGDPNALARLEITSNPTGQVWVANVGDDRSVTTINGTTPFSQDFPAPDGLGASVRHLNAGGDLTACLTNLTTGDRRCATTSTHQGIVSISVTN